MTYCYNRDGYLILAPRRSGAKVAISFHRHQGKLAATLAHGSLPVLSLALIIGMCFLVGSVALCGLILVPAGIGVSEIRMVDGTTRKWVPTVLVRILANRLIERHLKRGTMALVSPELCDVARGAFRQAGTHFSLSDLEPEFALVQSLQHAAAQLKDQRLEADARDCLECYLSGQLKPVAEAKRTQEQAEAELEQAAVEAKRTQEQAAVEARLADVASFNAGIKAAYRP